MATQSKRSSALSWIAFVVAGLVLALISGRWTPNLVPDSASYLDYSFSSLEQVCRSTRTPGYPLVLLILRTMIGISAVPVVQVIVHATAAWWLMRELGDWGMSTVPRLAAGIAVGVGCTAMDHVSTVSTDAIAASLGVMVATATLRAVRLGDGPGNWMLIALLATTTIFLRPAYLFLILWIPLAGALLGRVRGDSWRQAGRSSVWPSAAVLAALLAWMCLRLVVVGDFAILPFGHQNLAGILVQLVTDSELQELDGEGAELAAAVVAQKQRFASTGRGFAEGERGATMTIDARWDDMTYFVVIPAAREIAGEDVVAQHRTIAELNKAIIRRWPQRYVIWLLKAARRGAWAIAADIVMHPVFLFAIGVAILMVLGRAVSGADAPLVLDASPAMRGLTVVALTYMIAKLGFVILTSPPIGRFSDAAAVFLPAWIAAVFLSAWRTDAE